MIRRAVTELVSGGSDHALNQLAEGQERLKSEATDIVELRATRREAVFANFADRLRARVAQRPPNA
jgi:hypothetical protein